MNEPTEDLKRALDSVSLSPAEHHALRSVLVTTMHATPPRQPAAAFMFRHVGAFSLAALILMAGTTTSLAGQSLPGDFLYPVRLAVTDRIAVAAAGDEDARMERELAQMERILEDEELVASENLAALVVDIDVDAEIEREHKEDDDEEDDTDGRRGEGKDEDENDDRGRGRGSEGDVGIEAELRVLDRLLEQEESSAELELSL